MRTLRLGPLFAFFFLFSVIDPKAQQSPVPTVPQRDATALTLLQQSVAAMATTMPSDSTATGSVTIVEGSLNESGTVSIQTKGTSETSETINLPDGSRSIVYSNQDAKEINGPQSVNSPLELMVVDQCADFPLPLLSAFLTNADESLRYVGQETVNGTSVQHIQVWNSFASQPRMRKLSALSGRDIWLDSTSSLPVKIAWLRQPGEGAVHVTRMEIVFSNYTNVNGIQYPFQISKLYNGTPWQTITIQNVSFNTGLTDAQFQAQ